MQKLKRIKLDDYYGANLRIRNVDYHAESTEIHVADPEDVKKIVLWYSSFCAGDIVEFFLNEEQFEVDVNGYVVD